MPNPQPTDLCVFVAEIVGGHRLASRLGEAETARAIERCLNRIDLAVGGSGGEITARDRSAVIATFEHCDGGVMAACEAIDRVRKLPPVSGTHMQIRIGVHYGPVSEGTGDGVEGARLVLQACDVDQSLASARAVAQLSSSVRHFASAEAYHDDALGKLPWPVFTIGTQSAASMAPSASLRPRPDPSSPLTTPKSSLPPNSPAFATGKTTRRPIGPRLCLKHQQHSMFIEENRPVILIGRELGNDIVIIDPRASRQHARVERRRDGFVLIDQSTNGCFVSIDGHKEQCVKGAEIPLSGTGRFGCGFSSQEFEEDLVFFELT
ncbi:MAG: FHA domain-containing protein [Azoarcus sp.]|jgi:hypothetical protein|nr:FHA domain-containing protein [Azoarcus sp.]